MTDEVQTALIAGLLGGGVAGGIFGWLASLSTQGRQFRETNRHRFTDLRRERYAAFLREVDEHVRVFLMQRAVAFENAADGGSRPLPALGSTDEMSHMASEIGLLSWREDLAETASNLYQSVVALDEGYAVDTQRPDLYAWVMRTQDDFHQSVEDPLSVHRDNFVILAREELAVEPTSNPGPLARLGIRR